MYNLEKYNKIQSCTALDGCVADCHMGDKVV